MCILSVLMDYENKKNPASYEAGFLFFVSVTYSLNTNLNFTFAISAFDFGV